jgi:hypothetical protein
LLAKPAGYAIMESDAKSVMMLAGQLYPRVSFKVHEVLSINDMDQLLKAMMETAQKAAKK